MDLQLDSGLALVIVAHPDDETIWMGGTILMHPEIQWTIISLCRRSDMDRYPRFQKVCAAYGARCQMGDLEDDGQLNIRESVPIAKQIIREFTENNSFDYIFTHALDGEYGHPRHKGAARAVRQLFAAGGLRARRIFHFAYTLDKIKNIPVTKAKSDIVVKLPENIFRKKKYLIQNEYGFQSSAFEMLSAGPVEKFNLHR